MTIGTFERSRIFTATAQRAACRLDQSTQKGNHLTDHHTQLLANS
jgi:hypothetical protein